MIFKLHYFLLTAGGNALSILLGVFIETYTDATPAELGALLMVTPFLAMFGRPILCSMADRQQAHRKYLLMFLLIRVISFAPFIVIPFMGERLYRNHARACWYSLAALKICGDLAGGGLNSVADSLAINYASRVGTSFSTYRVWGTISWMLFGLIIGQVNEVWFLPKYVPAFMILIGSLILDAFLIWLWPAEYFIMTEAGQQQQVNATGGTKKQLAASQHCLVPRQVVWAQAKAKLSRLLCCCTRTSSSWDREMSPSEQQQNDERQRNAGSQADHKANHNDQQKEWAEEKAKENRGLNKMAQVKILAILVRRDKRIPLYLAYFVLAGACHATMSFFFISLSRICHSQGSCDFSQLAGLLQFSMAALETILFIYIKRIIDKIGRLNSAALAMLLSSGKFLFYGTIWSQVSPYYALLSEGVTGVIFGINLTLMVEVGHLFSSEVKFLIPELLERNILPINAEMDKLKYSLASTMQALVSSASEGVGMGCGSLVYGLALERVSYETLWFSIGLTCSSCLIILLVVNTIDTIFDLKFGLDVKEKQKLSIDLEREATGDLKGKC